MKPVTVTFRIYGNIASSKNSKRWTGKMLINSKTAIDCYKRIQPQLMGYKEAFLKETADAKRPMYLNIFFYRDSRRRFDYTNIFQLFADALVKCGLIEDDNADVIIPVFHGYEVVDKASAGCKFWIT